MALTPKQEGFCQDFVETGNASEAYRRNYNTENMKPETVNRAAKELVDNPKIAARIEELRDGVEKRHQLTIADLIKELEEARALAFETGKAGPAVQASMGKAKLLGLDRQVIDHTSTDGSMSPKPSLVIDKSVIKEIAKQLNEDC